MTAIFCKLRDKSVTRILLEVGVEAQYRWRQWINASPAFGIVKIVIDDGVLPDTFVSVGSWLRESAEADLILTAHAFPCHLLQLGFTALYYVRWLEVLGTLAFFWIVNLCLKWVQGFFGEKIKNERKLSWKTYFLFNFRSFYGNFSFLSISQIQVVECQGGQQAKKQDVFAKYRGQLVSFCHNIQWKITKLKKYNEKTKFSYFFFWKVNFF